LRSAKSKNISVILYGRSIFYSRFFSIEKEDWFHSRKWAKFKDLLDLKMDERMKLVHLKLEFIS